MSDRRRHRDFGLLAGGQAVSNLGTHLTSVALPVLASVELGAEPAQMGVIVAVMNSGFLVLGVPAGMIVDRVNLKATMFAADLVRACAFGTIAAAAIGGWLTIPSLIVLAALASAGRVFFELAYQSLVPRLVPRTSLVKGNSLLEGVRSTAQMAGPGIGGWLTQLLGSGRTIGLDALTFLASAGSVCLLKTQAGPRSVRGTGAARPRLGNGLRIIAHHRVLRSIIASSAMSNFFFVAASALTVPFLVRDAGVTAGWAGTALSVGAVAGIAAAASTPVLTRRLGTLRSIWLVPLLTAPANLLMPFSGPGPGLIVLVFAVGIPAFGQVIFNVLQTSYRQAAFGPDVLAQVNAASRFLVMALTPVGALTGGFLGEMLGGRWALLAVGIGLVIAVCPLLIAIALGRDGHDDPLSPREGPG